MAAACTAEAPAGAGAFIEGRHARLADIEPGAVATVLYREGERFDLVALGANTVPVERNSIVLIPGLLTAAECAGLIEEVEQEHDAGNYYSSGIADPEEKLFHIEPGGGDERDELEAYQRYMISELSPKTQALFDTVLRERLLPFVTKELPRVAEAIWAKSGLTPPAGATLSAQRFKFASQEPAINRYRVGGRFSQHSDHEALTLNVLLAEKEGTFEGGGTVFWCEDGGTGQGDGPTCPLFAAAQRESRNPTLRLEQLAGVGTVFNGRVRHSGMAVAVGIRHLMVASFSIETDGNGGLDVPADSPLGPSESADSAAGPTEVVPEAGVEAEAEAEVVVTPSSASLLGTLGLDKGARDGPITDADIKAAYHALCRQHHPDRMVGAGAAVRHPGLKLNIPPYLFCMCWCPDFEFRGT